jgi:hypothetical protein
VFENNHAFKDGKLTTVDSMKISSKDAHKAVATLDYLISKHDLTSLQPYFKQDLIKVSDSLGKLKSQWSQNSAITDYELRGNKLEWAKKQLNLGRFSGYYRDGYDDADTASIIYPKTYIFSNHYFNIYAVGGFDYLVQINNNGADTTTAAIKGLIITSTSLGSGLLSLKVGNETATFNIRPNLDSLTDANVLKKYQPAFKGSINNYLLPDDALLFIKSTKSYKVALRITMVNLSKDKKIDINNIGGYYLIKKL